MCVFFPVLAAFCCSIVGYFVAISFQLSTSRYHNCHLSLSVACVHLALSGVCALNLGYLTGDNTNSDLCVSSEIAKEMKTGFFSLYACTHINPQWFIYFRLEYVNMITIQIRSNRALFRWCRQAKKSHFIWISRRKQPFFQLCTLFSDLTSHHTNPQTHGHITGNSAMSMQLFKSRN